MNLFSNWTCNNYRTKVDINMKLEAGTWNCEIFSCLKNIWRMLLQQSVTSWQQCVTSYLIFIFFFIIWFSLRYSSHIFVVSTFHYFICWYNWMFWYLARFQSNFRNSNLEKTDQDLVAIMFIISYGLITENLRFKYVMTFCKVIVKVSYSDVITTLLFFVALCNFSYLKNTQLYAAEIYKVFFISQIIFCRFRHN